MQHYRPKRCLLVIALLAILALQGHRFATAADAAKTTTTLAWHNVPGKYTELRLGDRPILRYMYQALDNSTEQSRFETYKVFHHLYDPSGKRLLTNGPSGDTPYPKDVRYPHHRGLYYGFNRITYGDGKQADTWHCPDGESQQHVKFLSEEVGPHFGRHRLAINWHGKDGQVFAREEREITARIRPTGTLIEFASLLKSATGDAVHLDGDPQHAGVQFRASDKVAKETAAQTYYLRTQGKGELGETRNWNPADPNDALNPECTNRPWNAMSFVLDDQRYTALYLDHPDNPKPARYSERDYGRFGSYFAIEVTNEKPLRVKYRVWVQEGEMTRDQCEAMAKEFIRATDQRTR